MEEIEDLLMRGEIKAALVIDPSFERDLLSLHGHALQIIIDGTEPESGGFAVDHIGGRAEEFVERVARRPDPGLWCSLDSLQPIDLRVRTWYNPT